LEEALATPKKKKKKNDPRCVKRTQDVVGLGDEGVEEGAELFDLVGPSRKPPVSRSGKNTRKKNPPNRTGTTKNKDGSTSEGEFFDFDGIESSSTSETGEPPVVAAAATPGRRNAVAGPSSMRSPPAVSLRPAAAIVAAKDNRMQEIDFFSLADTGTYHKQIG
jgi:hypothetical protein